MTSTLFSDRGSVMAQWRVRRERAETILAAAEHLPPADRTLIEQVYRHGLSWSQLTDLLGLPRDRVRRRVRKLLKIMDDPLYRFLAGHLDLFDPPVQRTARLVVFAGLSMRRVARLTGASLHTVRAPMHTVRALARCGCARPPPQPAHSRAGAVAP